jgi:hypothetical protein
MNTNNEITYLIGSFEDGLFWCRGETQDRGQAVRVYNQYKKDDPNKEWEVYVRITTYEKCIVKDLDAAEKLTN